MSQLIFNFNDFKINLSILSILIALLMNIHPQIKSFHAIDEYPSILFS